MHLSSITIRGFKSFPERTRLVFAPGVSVIVGLTLAAVGLTAIGGMTRVDVDTARKVEDAMESQREAIESLERSQVATPSDSTTP